MPEEPMEEVCQLPNGCTLYRKKNEVGGNTYYSDEIGGGVFVWDTCLVDMATLLAAMSEELKLNYKASIKRQKANRVVEQIMQEAQRFVEQKKTEGWTRADFAAAMKEMFEEEPQKLFDPDDMSG